MAISPIRSYDMPSKDSWPAPRAPWQLDPARAALLVHDMQAYFLAPFEPGRAPLEPLITNVVDLRNACAAASMPVIFSAQPGEQTRGERGLLWDLWGPGIATRPELSGLIDVCRPGRDDVMLRKRRYSAFHETELLALLRAHGRDQLVICGVYAHIGCLATAVEGFMLGIQPFVVADAIADFSLEDHRVALRQVARTCGVVTTARQVLALVNERRVRSALHELLGPAAFALGIDDDLGDHGLDSLRGMQLFERLLPKGHGHDFEALIGARSLRALTELLLLPESGHELVE